MRLDMHLSLFVTIGTLIVSVADAGAQQRSAPAPPRTPPVANATAPSTPPMGRRLATKTRPDDSTLIQGNALNSTNGPLANAPVRLRDARFGRIVDEAVTDRSGFFAFRSIEPGSFVVELLGADQTVVAASQILHVEGGTSVTTVVKLPFKGSGYGGLLGHTAASALAVASAAAASGVLAMQVTGTEASPNGTSPQTTVTSRK
jgi:hypothetical protein